MTPADRDARAIALVAGLTSIDAARRMMHNAAREGNEVVRAAAFARIVSLSAGEHDDPVARACWSMVHTVEQIRRDQGRKVWRMQRMRPKIAREGERAAIEYCATHATDGFREVIDYGLAEFTAEAILLSFPGVFTEEASRATARRHLSEAGVDAARFEMPAASADAQSKSAGTGVGFLQDLRMPRLHSSVWMRQTIIARA